MPAEADRCFFLFVAVRLFFQSNPGSPTYSVLKSDFSAAILNEANTANLVTVIAQGSQYTLYINNQYILTVTDATTSQGAIGVGVSDLVNATDVAFSNAKVWTLS